MGNANDSLEAWIQAQQGYWAAWTELAQRAMGASAASAREDSFHDASAHLPPDARALYDQLLAASRDFFALGQHGLAGGQANPADPEAWLAGLGKLWGDTGPARSWLQSWMQPFLAMPPLGPARETQAQYQRLAQCQLEFLAALQAYQAGHGELAAATSRALRQTLLARSGTPVTSLRELYDLWVETAEAAHGEWALTPAYQALYGRLVNTLMALKRQQGALADQALAALSLPTRGELDSLAQGQQALRRENRALRQALSDLAARIQALEQAASTTPANPSPPAAKAARRRAAAKKPE